MLIPKPTGLFVLNIRSPNAHALRTFHSAADGANDSHEVSAGMEDCVVDVAVAIGAAVVGDDGSGMFCGLAVVGDVLDGSLMEPSK
jgi:hypothetical protein